MQGGTAHLHSFLDLIWDINRVIVCVREIREYSALSGQPYPTVIRLTGIVLITTLPLNVIIFGEIIFLF